MPALQGPARVADEQLKAALAAARLDDGRQGRPQLRSGARPRCARRAAASGTDPAPASPRGSYAGCRRTAALQAGLTKTPSEAQAGHLLAGHRRPRTEAAQLARRPPLRRRPAAGRRPTAGSRAKRKGWRTAWRRSATASRGSPPARRSSPPASPSLTGGTEALSQSLAEGYGRSYPLQAGLRRASVRILATGGSLERRAAAPAPPRARPLRLGLLRALRPRRRRAAAARPRRRRHRPRKQRPGGDPARLLPLRAQLARLDRLQRSNSTTTRRRSAARPASPPGSAAAPPRSTTTAG